MEREAWGREGGQRAERGRRGRGKGEEGRERRGGENGDPSVCFCLETFRLRIGRRSTSYEFGIGVHIDLVRNAPPVLAAACMLPRDDRRQNTSGETNK